MAARPGRRSTSTATPQARSTPAAGAPTRKATSSRRTSPSARTGSRAGSFARWPASEASARWRGRADLLPNLLDEGLRAAGVGGLVLDDLADQLRLRVVRNRARRLDFLGELLALEGRRPVRLLRRGRRLVGLPIVRRLRLGHVAEAGVLRLASGAVARRTRL